MTSNQEYTHAPSDRAMRQLMSNFSYLSKFIKKQCFVGNGKRCKVLWKGARVHFTEGKK